MCNLPGVSFSALYFLQKNMQMEPIGDTHNIYPPPPQDQQLFYRITHRILVQSGCEVTTAAATDEAWQRQRCTEGWSRALPPLAMSFGSRTRMYVLLLRVSDLAACAESLQAGDAQCAALNALTAQTAAGFGCTPGFNWDSRSSSFGAAHPSGAVYSNPSH